MAVTVTQLAARALRRLGVAAVAASDRPANTAIGTLTDVAARALQSLGLPVPPSEWPTLTAVLVPANIALDALLRLAAIPADQTPSAADQTLAEGTVSIVHDNLVRQGLVSWDVSAIPRGLAEEYSILVALRIAAHFGKTPDPSQVPVQEERIRRFSAVAWANGLALEQAEAAHAQLVAIGAASWDKDHIPVAVADQYIELVRMAVAPLLRVEIPNADRQALQEQVRRVSLVLGSQTLAEDAVMATHANLAAQGKARWSIFDIPDFAEAIYEVLAANRLAPAFGVPIDQISGAAAMADLNRLVALGASSEPVRAEYF